MKKILKAFVAMLTCLTIMTPVMAEDKANLPSSSLASPRTGTHTISTLISSGHKSNYDLGYHPKTDVWRKVSAYHFTNTSTVNCSLSFTVSGQVLSGTIGISNTNSSSFTTTVTANQSQYSKIRVYVGFNWKYFRADVYENTTGSFVRSVYYTVIEKTHEEFKVVYQ